MLLASLLMVGMLSQASLPSHDQKTTTFLGFSKNEWVCAWRTEVVSKKADGAVHRFALVSLMNSEDGEILAILRASPLQQSGGKVRSRASLLAENPWYARAEPIETWHKVRKQMSFYARPLNMGDNTVRLAIDSNQEVVSSKEAIQVLAPMGKALSFQPVARAYDGALVPLGHFTCAAVENAALAARVKVYHSRSGYHVAVHTRVQTALPGQGASPGGYEAAQINQQFATKAADLPGRQMATVRRMPRVPIATIEISRFLQERVVWDSVEKLYLQENPETYAAFKRLASGW